MPTPTTTRSAAAEKSEAMRRSLVAQLVIGQARVHRQSHVESRLPRPRSAEELVSRHQIRLTPAARELLTAHTSPAVYFQYLLAHELDADARRVLACALPRRRALWWACLSAWDALESLAEGATADVLHMGGRGRAQRAPGCLSGGSLHSTPGTQRSSRDNAPVPLAEGATADVLRAVAAYVVEPCDEHCQRVADAGRGLKRASLTGCLVYAALVAHGSVTGPGKPRVPAPPHVLGRLIEAAVYLSSVTKDVTTYRRHLREYLLLGQQIARGPAPWRNHKL